jgi:hypothetical protein
VSKNDFHNRSCSYCLTVTRRVSLVDQEMYTLLWHPSSSRRFNGVRVTQFLIICSILSSTIIVLIFLFILAIVLYVFLRTTASDGVRVTRSLVVCPFSFDHCVVRPSSNYGVCYPYAIFKLSIDNISGPC